MYFSIKNYLKNNRNHTVKASVTLKKKSIDLGHIKKKSIERPRYYLSPSKVDLPDVPH
jgi:hypothetical protein